MPLRKQDVVTARMVSITYLKVLLFIPLIATLLIRFFIIYPSIINNGGTIPDLGFDINQERLDLATKYNLIGVASWKKGFDNDDIWKLYEEYMKK